MKKLTLLFLIAIAVLFVSKAVYADNCDNAFDHTGACGRNCMSANPGCGLQGCLALCAGSGATATTQTTVAAVDTNPGFRRAGVNTAGVDHGAAVAAKHGGATREGTRRR